MAKLFAALLANAQPPVVGHVVSERPQAAEEFAGLQVTLMESTRRRLGLEDKEIKPAVKIIESEPDEETRRLMNDPQLARSSSYPRVFLHRSVSSVCSLVGSCGVSHTLILAKGAQPGAIERAGERAIQGLEHALAVGRNMASVLCLMNGSLPAKVLTSQFHGRGLSRHLFIGTTALGANWRQSPAIVQQGGDGVTRVANNEADHSERFDILLSFLSSLGVFVSPVAARDRAAMVFDKQFANAIINTITAAAAVSNGELLTERYQTIVREMAREILEIAIKANIPISFNHADAPVDEAAVAHVNAILEATRNNVTSMASDVARGRISEIESIAGELIDLADRHNVKAEKFREAVEKIREIDRKQTQFNTRIKNT